MLRPCGEKIAAMTVAPLEAKHSANDANDFKDYKAQNNEQHLNMEIWNSMVDQEEINVFSLYPSLVRRMVVWDWSIGSGQVTFEAQQQQQQPTNQ